MIPIGFPRPPLRTPLVNLGLVWEDYIDFTGSPARLKAFPGIRVIAVNEMVRQGNSYAQLKQVMPGLTLEMVLACLAYASHGG